MRKLTRNRLGADEGDEKRQEETANSVLSAGRDPKEAKYIRSQMLRVAADARLHILVERLLKEGADPNMQAHNSQYDQWIDKRWLVFLRPIPLIVPYHMATALLIHLSQDL